MCAFLTGKKTYYLKDQLAYTEDHVVIKSLFLMNVSPGLEAKQLRRYFQKYGQVVRLHLFIGDAPRKLKFGYVSFSDARHAAKALQRKVHYVGGRRLCVQPSDSWHQPDAQDLVQKPTDAELQEPPAPIMMLNDDCLELILRQLELPDRVRFARTCNRFRNIYLALAPILDKFVNFDVFELMTVWDLRDFFQLSGAHIKHIEGIVPKRHYNRLSEYVGMNCINLQSIRIVTNYLSKANNFKMFAKLERLETLEMRNCNLNDSSLQPLKLLKRLKKLDVSYNDRLIGHIRLPETLESLTMNNCCDMKPNLLRKMFSEVKQLKELSMKGIYLYPYIRKLFTDKSCEFLEALTLSCDDVAVGEYKYVAQLPNLKKLILNLKPNTEALSIILNNLVEHKPNQLEYFDIRSPNCFSSGNLAKIGQLHGLRTLNLPNNQVISDETLESLFNLQNLEEINIKHSVNVTNYGVLQLIIACSKLQILHLEQCGQLTDKLLKDLVFKLQKYPTVRPLPIKLNITGTSINEFTMQNNAGVAAGNIVKASFNHPNIDEVNMFEYFSNMSDMDRDFDSHSDDDSDYYDFNGYEFDYNMMD